MAHVNVLPRHVDRMNFKEYNFFESNVFIIPKEISHSTRGHIYERKIGS